MYPSSAVEDSLESLVGDVVHLLLGDHRSADSCALVADQPQPPLGEGGEVAGDGGQGGHGDVWRRGGAGSDWGALTPGPATPVSKTLQLFQRYYLKVVKK